MARPLRLLACSTLVVLLCALLHYDGVIAKVPHAAESAQHRIASALALLILQLIQAVITLLPGLVVALGISVFYMHRERLSPKSRGALTLLLVLLAATGLLLTQRGGARGATDAAAAEVEGTSRTAGELAVTPHSGEEVLMSDGTFVRLADPSQTDGGPVSAGWRQGLAQALVTAIAQGQEQVVIMFTRQGCPWCDRQLPVLQEAIRRRQAALGGAGAAAPATAFVAAGGAGSLLTAPLRVFILDAEEFPHLIQQFRVEAFPTSLIFGRPRVTPLMGRGFLDEETFEQVCREAAFAEPEPEEGAAPRRRRRRGLFR
mmetsp:Transcript_136676/g.380898  ORF Transcript_136676/g.380898 Transcript_136676/m.380898 type:complete len:316 (-) Transcript_136676:134-1081(-)